jgi:hypothetical protein
MCLATAWFGSTLLDRTPDFYPGLGAAAIVLAAAALVVLVAASLPKFAGSVPVKRMATVAAGLGLCATLLAPGAYALDTMNTAYSSGDPHPGPVVADGLGGALNGLAAAFGGGPGGGGGPAGLAGLLGGGSTDSALTDYLVANRGTATWIVAAGSAMQAGSIELATGLPVMAMGGFTGSDPTPTLDQFKAYISSGRLRFVLAGGIGGFGGGFGGAFGGGDSSSRTAWVTSTCVQVSIAGSGSSGLYDCAAAK